MQWLETKKAPLRPGLCTTVVKAKVLHHSHKNCTPTYMAQCCSLTSLPELPTPLAEAHSTKLGEVVGTRIKKKCGNHATIRVIDASFPSSAWAGCCLHPRGRGSHPRHWLVYFLGMPTLDILTYGRDTLVAFHELYHNAVELNHVYRHVERCSSRSLGNEALRESTRKHRHCRCDSHLLQWYGRLLSEEGAGWDLPWPRTWPHLQWRGNDLQRTPCALKNAPQSYHKVKAAAAEHQSLRIYVVFPVEVANLSSMRPDALRHHESGRSDWGDQKDGGSVLKVFSISWLESR